MHHYRCRDPVRSCWYLAWSLWNLLRSHWDPLRSCRDLPRSFQDLVRSNKKQQISVDFCKFQRRFEHFDADRDPTRNWWHPTTWTTAFGGSTAGPSIRDPKWLGWFRVRHKPDSDWPVDNPNLECHIDFICISLYIYIYIYYLKLFI